MNRTLEKEITPANKRAMEKRCRMYADAVLKLGRKNREKEGSRK